MKIEFTLKDAARFVVNLGLDLKPYCEAYAVLSHNQRYLIQLTEARVEKSSSISDKEIETAENEINTAAVAFAALREDHLDQLTLLSGEMIWLKIKNLLKTQCNLSDPVEQELYSVLSKRGTDSSLPLVIECLNMSFIELLKNSIDAILINYIKDSSTTTFLQMELSLSVVDSAVSIVIKDNAGGFPEDYLTYFPSIKDAEVSGAIEIIDTGNKRDFEGYCFGGSGLAHVVLANFLLRGELLVRWDEYCPTYVIEKGATDFHLCNNAETKGAEIRLRSPMLAFPLIAPLKPEERLVESPVLLELPSRSRLSFFALRDLPASPDADLLVSAADEDNKIKGRSPSGLPILAIAKPMGC